MRRQGPSQGRHPQHGDHAVTTTRQRSVARKTAKKAPKARRGMSVQARARAQPASRKRARPGAKGAGRFFHIEVRPRRGFTLVRTQDVGERGGIERVAGKRASGSWSTLKWLVGKEHAHREGRRLVPDSTDARRLLKTLGSAPVHVRGDRFEAKDRRNVPEKAKPTAAQKRARRSSIKKAQAARRKRTAAKRAGAAKVAKRATVRRTSVRRTTARRTTARRTAA